MRHFFILWGFFLIFIPVDSPLSNTFFGMGIVGTSHQKINGTGHAQDGIGLNIRGGTKFPLIKPLNIFSRVQAGYKTVKYKRAGNAPSRTTGLLDLEFVFDWHPSEISIGAPIGVTLISPKGDPQKLAPSYGVIIGLHDIAPVEPWFEFKWTSLDDEHRYLFVTAGLNYNW